MTHIDDARARAREELRAGVAVLTTAYECTAGTLSIDQAAQVFAEVAVEHFPDHPVELVLPVAWVALRALSMAAEVLSVDVPALLSQLGAEAVSDPPAGG